MISFLSPDICIFLLPIPVNCIYPLGLESGYIPDEALTQGFHQSNPTNIRLNKVITEFPFGWQALQDALGRVDYLQVS